LAPVLSGFSVRSGDTEFSDVEVEAGGAEDDVPPGLVEETAGPLASGARSSASGFERGKGAESETSDEHAGHASAMAMAPGNEWRRKNPVDLITPKRLMLGLGLLLRLLHTCPSQSRRGIKIV
jgi:hypothetical protein